MDSDKKEISGYLDGVPFTVGSKFCPPRPVSLPFALGYELPKELLSIDQYDFSLEKKFLAFCQAKEEAEKKMREEEEEASAKASTALETMTATSTSDGAACNPIVSNSMLWNPDTILQPKFQALTASSLSDNILKINKESPKKINFSDFEIDTRSPFDYMELQTINDLEELNTVFQEISQEEEKTSNDYSEASTGNVSKSISYPLVQNCAISNCDDYSINNPATASSTTDSKTFNRSNDGHLSLSTPSVSSVCNNVLPQAEKVKRNSLFSDSVTLGYPVLTQVPCMPVFTDPSSFGGYSSIASLPLRSSKSIPDLSNLSLNSDVVVPAARSHTPPAKACDTSYFVSGSDFKSTLNNRSQCSTSSSTNGFSSKPLDHCVGLQDPYDELNNNEQLFVDSVTNMGFHRGQVSRTVKHLGTDEKKVIEHLCQIQALEESGYDQLEAEAALHLHDYDKNEAIQYLELLNQIQDLGFEREAIKKALVQNKNNRDMVIDALLANSQAS